MLHNIDPTSASNIEITLNQLCTTSKQSLLNVAQSFLTLFQRWYDIISSLFQRGPNVSWSYIETNLPSEKYGFAENILHNILTI